MSATQLGEMTAAELGRRYATGEISPVEVMRDALARAERVDPELNAFAHLAPEAALADARASEARWRAGEARGPLDGAPTTIKELTPVRGMPVRPGSVLGDPAPATADLEIVTRLREAGVAILGLTTSPELGWKGVTHSPVGGVTRNPWDPAKASGGSSGGAGVCAALNIGVLHEGSDAAGSIRIPAAWCGTFGIKPTYGWIPADPATNLFELAHRGPLSRTVEDAGLFLDAVAGPSTLQRYGWCPSPVPGFAEIARRGPEAVKGLRIGYARTLDGAKVDPQVAALVERAAERMAALGAIVEEADPGLACPQAALLVLWRASQAATVGGYAPSPAQRARMDPGLLAQVEMGKALSAVDFIRADQVRADLRVAMERFFTRHDALMLPTMPTTAIEAGVDFPPDSGMTDWTDWSPFTYPFNMTEQPAASVNCGFDDAGMPVGLQFVGPRFRDDVVLTLAAAYQAAHPEASAPPLSAPSPRGAPGGPAPCAADPAGPRSVRRAGG